MVNLRGVDLNLLTVFEAVYEECNQQRAAERLAMTQPAISGAMSRLRDALREELFVPGARGVTPTVAADRLYARIRPALETIRDGIRAGLEFDAKSAKRTFRLTATYASLGSVGEMLAWFAKEAPGSRLVIEAGEDPDELLRRLRIGEVDVLADYARYDDEELVHEIARYQDFVAIARKGHPRIDGRITKKQLDEERHVAYIESGGVRHVPMIQDTAVGLAWRADVEIGNVLAIPSVVCQTDLVAVTIRGIAEFYAKRLGLQLLELPFKVPAVPIHAIWHRSRERDPAHAWLRKGLKALMSRAKP
jgi:DNA-binding transcriptional LysR family regulator